MANPANRGRTCSSYKRVPSVYGGTVKRCASYGGRRRRRGGYRKGRSPFNKGKKCRAMKRVWSSALNKFVQRCARFKNGASTKAAVARNIRGGFAPGVPHPAAPDAPATAVYGGMAPGVPATIFGAPAPSYTLPKGYKKPAYKARQMVLPGTRKRPARGPQQPELPFQSGLPAREALPPPPPPTKTRRRLTEHEKLIRAARRSPGHVMDGLPI